MKCHFQALHVTFAMPGLNGMNVVQCWIFLATKVLFVIAQTEKIGALYCNQTTACYFCCSVIGFLMRILHQLTCIF